MITPPPLQVLCMVFEMEAHCLKAEKSSYAQGTLTRLGDDVLLFTNLGACMT
jgi:hypothetical protein